MNRKTRRASASKRGAAKAAKAAETLLKLDLGCGPRKVGPEWTGVDARTFEGAKVDVVADLRKRWPWKDCTVDEVHCSHMLEHLTGEERVHFANELYRVLKHGAKATIITPHWASCRAYGDVTHQWPPVSEFWFFYLNAEWRKTNAPHNDGYTCDFEGPPAMGYALRQDLVSRTPDVQQFALGNYKEAAQDIVTTLVKK